MDAVFLMVALFVGYIIAYRTYGRWLARRVFKLRQVCNMPSEEFADGVDYVPTSRMVVFGHHFTSIAGTGPIVGPAIAIIWGWVPAVIWVFVGSIFIFGQKLLVFVLPPVFASYLVYGFVRPRISRKIRREIEEDEEEEEEDFPTEP